MLTFETETRPKITALDLEKMHLIDVLEDCREFKILVDGEIFFSEPYYLILEMAQYSQEWLKKGKRKNDIFGIAKYYERWLKKDERKNNFIYNTIDNDENPLLAFYEQEDGWKIESVWQEFECTKVFSTEEVEDFIKNIISHVAI